jgi:alkanesulfonate monooxygenase SsuD/methylene tetrahydromethanopterin reductase-like flavin-dependent oxidoreductase (luciferase family)
MRIGVVILPEYRWNEAVRIWSEAEALGFGHAWTYDHLAWRSMRDSAWFGAFPTLAAAATVTSRIRLGTLVCSPNFRHPVVLTREVLALDDISDGRFELGIGAGGEGWDATVLGQPAWSRAERAARYAEFVELADQLLRRREVTFTGRYYSADGARSHPGCLQEPRVPFVLAGTGPKAMSVVARFADAWVTTGPRDRGLLDTTTGVTAVAGQMALLEEACHLVGRSPGSARRMVLLGPNLEQGLSSAQEFVDTVGAYREIGMTDLVVHWPRTGEPFRGDRSRFEAAVVSQLESATGGTLSERSER